MMIQGGDRPPPLTAEEVGPVEFYKIIVATDRFRTREEAHWAAERYGRMCVDKIRVVLLDHADDRWANRVTNAENDAYNFARLAHSGWRALRGL